MEYDESLPIFISESREQLQILETCLLDADVQPTDDILNTIFRSAHTIKGSSGIFGLDTIVDFAHHVEHVLDLLRKGQIEFTSELITLLLKCADHISHLINLVESHEIGDYTQTKNEKALIVDLENYSSKDGAADKAFGGESLAQESDALETSVPESSVQKSSVQKSPGQKIQDKPVDGVDNPYWHISIRFSVELFRDGMDPYSIVQYLQSIGEIKSLVLIDEGLPSLENLDEEQCYLGLELDYHIEGSSDGNAEERLNEAFEFINEESLVEMVPPHCKLLDYSRLLLVLPESDTILLAVWGENATLNERELQTLSTIDLLNDEDDSDTVDDTVGGSRVDEHTSSNIGNQENKDDVKADRENKTSANHLKKVAPSKTKKYVKVDAEQLDNLINVVGELVIGGGSTKLLAAGIDNRDLIESHELMSGLIESVRDRALALRMVPLTDLFGRFPRLIRDLSAELNKKITLTITGAETAIDRSMAEKISDPMIHLVRNAADHGLEDTSVRESLGKAPEGEIILNAYHSSGSVTIEIKDNGRGLDKEKIVDNAISKGLIDSADKMPDSEIYALIFAPGFSTADKVTNISGRGVGLDVVKKNIESMRGQIEVISEKGIGTIFRLNLPLTLSIIDGFQVTLGRERYVLPMDLVEECFEFNDGVNQPDFGCLNLRNVPLPYVRLRALLKSDLPAAERENVVVLSLFEHRYGLVVDELPGEVQVVIKPMHMVTNSIPIFSGASVLSDGSISIVLDVPSLIKLSKDIQYQAINAA